MLRPRKQRRQLRTSYVVSAAPALLAPWPGLLEGEGGPALQHPAVQPALEVCPPEGVRGPHCHSWDRWAQPVSVSAGTWAPRSQAGWGGAGP